MRKSWSWRPTILRTRGFLFPYIHADTFFDIYAAAKSTNMKNVRASWLALFNMILANAMCSGTDDQLSFDDRVASSEIFYQRAVRLTARGNCNGTSLEMVQYLLLMVQYLQSTQRTIATYAMHGQAVKSAYQIGLQSEEVADRFPPLEREQRKRTFFACVLIDRHVSTFFGACPAADIYRTLSLTFGRHASIPDVYVRMPLPFHVDAWTLRTTPSLDMASSLSFYNATM
ncbi:hypothetical protein MRB53_041888 [Persea americana]|nr:hypothetical protein MRB53_041888 [Persea americana]